MSLWESSDWRRALFTVISMSCCVTAKICRCHSSTTLMWHMELRCNYKQQELVSSTPAERGSSLLCHQDALYRCHSYSYHGFHSKAAACRNGRKRFHWSRIVSARTRLRAKPEACGRGRSGPFGRAHCSTSVPFTGGRIWQTSGE